MVAVRRRGKAYERRYLDFDSRPNRLYVLRLGSKVKFEWPFRAVSSDADTPRSCTDPTLGRETWGTPLACASGGGNFRVVERGFLVHKQSIKSRTDLQGEKGDTALVLACRVFFRSLYAKLRCGVVKLLFEAGANPTLGVNKEGKAAIDVLSSLRSNDAARGHLRVSFNKPSQRRETVVAADDNTELTQRNLRGYHSQTPSLLQAAVRQWRVRCTTRHLTEVSLVGSQQPKPRVTRLRQTRELRGLPQPTAVQAAPDPVLQKSDATAP